MFDELKTWWQNATPETQAAFQETGVVVSALLAGFFVGSMVVRTLRARSFDALLRLPGSSPGPEGESGFTPTFFAGMLVRLTVWAGAGWWLARQHGHAELADTLGHLLRRTWGLAAVLVAALSLGSLLARRLIDCLQGPAKAGADGSPQRNGAVTSQRRAAGALGAAAYVLSVLLVLLMAADSFDWPLTRSSALALWQLAQHLLTAGAALAIGLLGARWARDLTTSEGGTTPERRAGQYTGLVIVGATTILAVTVLLSSANLFLGLVALIALGSLLWLLRGYLPDVTAGLQLRTHKVGDVWIDGTRWQVVAIGLLTTEVTRDGEFHRFQNRHVLRALFHGAPAEEAVAR